MSQPTQSGIHKLSYLFNRPYNQHHWAKAFSEIEQLPDPSLRAVNANWRMDSRVEPGREKILLSHPAFHEKPDGAQWLKQVRDYFSQAICQPTVTIGGLSSAYLKPDNTGNLIPGGIPGHEQLIHVDSLNNMLWRLSSAEHSSFDFLADFYDITGQSFPQRPIGTAAPGDFAFKALVDKLVQMLLDKGPDTIKDLAKLLCDTLGPARPPWWACFYQEVRPLLKNQDWLGLCRSLGLGHLDEGHWLLTWRYEVKDSRPLYRPTAVEANTNPCHYPSPPSKQYGITMPLDEATKTAFREVIHPPPIRR